MDATIASLVPPPPPVNTCDLKFIQNGVEVSQVAAGTTITFRISSSASGTAYWGWPDQTGAPPVIGAGTISPPGGDIQAGVTKDWSYAISADDASQVGTFARWIYIQDAAGNPLCSTENNPQSLTITPAPVPAPAISYAGGVNAFSMFTSIGALVPSNSGGAITSCTVSPVLPPGLTLRPNCVVVGTPSAPALAATYTITASNSGGSSQAQVQVGNICGLAIKQNGSVVSQVQAGTTITFEISSPLAGNGYWGYPGQTGAPLPVGSGSIMPAGASVPAGTNDWTYAIAAGDPSQLGTFVRWVNIQDGSGNPICTTNQSTLTIF
jgi:hypothetical protein